MPRRRRTQSAIDSYLASQGVSSSGGRTGVLSHLTYRDANGVLHYTPFGEKVRRLQRIGTKDPGSRRKFQNRSLREEAHLANEHAFIHGERFQDPEYHDYYVKNPGRDAIGELERTYWNVYTKGYKGQEPRPLSIIAEDLRGFRRTDKAFHNNFSKEEVDHALRHLTVRALRESKLGHE